MRLPAFRGAGRSFRHQLQRAAIQHHSRCISSDAARKWSTPLAKQLAEAITVTGPVSLAAYMRQCLTSPDGGYYTSTHEGRDQFGKKGDFVTSPEISQIFGELVGVWMVAEWMAQGKRSRGVELVELGPGRGTLMDDMLRTISSFTPLVTAIEAVYLVEAGPGLRDAQRKLLCGDAPMIETSIGHRSISKYADIPIIWCEDLRLVPKTPSASPFFVAHEFFDALPIHAFQSVPSSQQQAALPRHPGAPPRASSVPQWRELVVSPTPPPSNLSISSVPPPTSSQPALIPEFELSLAKASNPNSLVLPESSPRYRALKDTPGAVIEISPESQSYAEEIARRIGGAATLDSPFSISTEVSGAALILDYGPADTIPINSLRGIRSHSPCSPFATPGQVDISADVDFVALADAALKASPNVEVHGPMEQGDWLQTMGIRERAEQLLSKLGPADTEQRARIGGAWERLIERGGGGMGRIYKVMAIIPVSGGKRRPVGFGGTVNS